MSSLFGGGAPQSGFQIVNFGSDLLGSYYTAKQTQASILSLPPVQSNVSLSNGNNNALTPWDLDKQIAAERFSESSAGLYKLLKKDYESIKGIDEFINFRTSLIRNSDLDDDSKSLFALYNALKNLKTIAEYAGDPRTSERKMAALEEQFQLGLSQVKGFISDQQFEDLTLLFGEKVNGVTAQAGLGKKQYDYVGPTIHQGKITDPISTLQGGETFTITLTRKDVNNNITTETTEDINITISTDPESRTLESVVASINAQIQATKKTDEEGEEVPLFQTKFFAEEVEKDKFALRIKTDFSETMTFSANDVEPAIYMSGNAEQIEYGTKLVEEDTPLTGFLTKITDLDEVDPTREFHNSIFARDNRTLLEPEKEELKTVDPLEGATNTTTQAVTTDSKGNVYIVGSTEGRFANHLNAAETGDAFLNKYDASGKLLWSRLVGSMGDATSYAVTVDNADNIIIAGQADRLTEGKSSDPLATSDNIFEGPDSFVVKYDNVGTQQWMYTSDTYGTDRALAVTTDADGNVYVTGEQNTKLLSSTVLTGDYNAYVMKLDGYLGTELDKVTVDNSVTDSGKALAIASDGNLLVSSHMNGEFILEKLDKDNFGTVMWSHNFGNIGTNGDISGIAVDGNRIYVAGTSNNSLTGGGTEIASPQGDFDNFVIAIDDAGATSTADWTKFIGTSSVDNNEGISIFNGDLYISGTTKGDLAGDLQASRDSFAMKIDGTTGTTEWAKQLGYGYENRDSSGITFASQGSSVLTKLGLPIGEFEDQEKRLIETQTTARAGDYFYIKINDSITKKIEIKAGDTYRTLANRINRASFQYMNAQVSFSSGTSKSREAEEEKEFDADAIIQEKLEQIRNERNGIIADEEFTVRDLEITGNSLKIATKKDGRVELIAGRGDKDALKKLGLQPSLILSTQELFALDEEENDDPKIGGVFAFKMDDRFNVAAKRDARYTARELDYAMTIVQSAFRSLTFDPVAEQLKKQALQQASGPIPPALQNQLSNYQDGLARMSTLAPTSGGAGLFI